MTTEIIEPRNGIIPGVTKWAVIGALWLWFAIALVSHHGAASPYSYAGAVVGSTMHRINGFVVNHDAPSVRPVTQFFYDAANLDLTTAHNLKLPLHSFLAACVAGFVRSYIGANDVVNLLALWLLSYVAVTFAESLAFPRPAILIASLTCAFLPVYTHYIGQPMQYIVGITVNFLVILAVMAGVRDPLRLGVLTAILTLSYDPYVYIAALVTWIAITLHWKTSREWGIYAAASLLPAIVWRGFLTTLGSQTVSTQVRGQYLEPVLSGWMRVITEPLSHLLSPFVNTHVGVVVSVEMTLALIYWPVLLLCVIALRPRFSLPLLLALFFVLEQLVTAAFDWEINPRRAIPLLFAFSCAYFVVVREKVHLRPWRLAFIAVMGLSALLTLSDALTRNPVVGYMITGEAMRDPTKQVTQVGESALERGHYPKLMRDEERRWWDMPPARVTRPLLFIFANVFAGTLVAALLFVLGERALLPRYVPIAVTAVLLVSLGARFL